MEKQRNMSGSQETRHVGIDELCQDLLHTISPKPLARTPTSVSMIVQEFEKELNNFRQTTLTDVQGFKQRQMLTENSIQRLNHCLKMINLKSEVVLGEGILKIFLELNAYKKKAKKGKGTIEKQRKSSLELGDKVTLILSEQQIKNKQSAGDEVRENSSNSINVSSEQVCQQREMSMSIEDKSIDFMVICKVLSNLQNCLKYFFIAKELEKHKTNSLFVDKKVMPLKTKNTFLEQMTPSQRKFDSCSKDPWDAMFLRMREKFMKKSCSELIAKYLQKQVKNQESAECRICSKNIELSKIEDHLLYCSKKQSFNFEIMENYQQRMKIIQKMKEALKQQGKGQGQEQEGAKAQKSEEERQGKGQGQGQKSPEQHEQQGQKQLKQGHQGQEQHQQQEFGNQERRPTNEELERSRKQLDNSDKQLGNSESSLNPPELGSIFRKLIQLYENTDQEVSHTTRKRSKKRRISITHNNNELQSVNLFLLKMEHGQGIDDAVQKDLLEQFKALQDKAYCLTQKIEELSYMINNQVAEKSEKMDDLNDLQGSIQFKKESKLIKKNSQEEEKSNAELLTNSLPRKKKFGLKKKFTEFTGAPKESSASEDFEEISFQSFEVLDFLGKGAFSSVYLVRKTNNLELYALKVIKVSANDQEQHSLIQKEYGVYKKIAGEHLVTAPFCFQEGSALFFGMEYMPGGDFGKILEDCIYLEQEEAKFYLSEIILAVEHLHTFGVIHRDLKPENIVFDENGHIKLTDFGLSEIKIKDKLELVKANANPNLKALRKKSMLNSKEEKEEIKLIGTPDYIAPEIIKGESLDNMSIDWWSLGVIAYEMLIGCRPFSDSTVEDIIENIIDRNIEWPEIGDSEEMISPVSVDLIEKLLDVNYQSRMDIEQIKNHPFFKDIQWDEVKQREAPTSIRNMLKFKMRDCNEYAMMSENLKLRKQIMEIIGECRTQKTGKVINLPDYIRYDLLTNLSPIEKKVNKRRQTLQKLRTVYEEMQKESISQLQNQSD